jgi:hypothetical protein
MKNKIILICAFVAIQSIQAQNTPVVKTNNVKSPKVTIEQKVDKEVSKMKSDLSLTPEQEAKVRTAATQKYQSLDMLEAEFKDRRKNIDSVYKNTINETLTVKQLKVKNQVRKANLEEKKLNKAKN